MISDFEMREADMGTLSRGRTHRHMTQGASGWSTGDTVTDTGRHKGERLADTDDVLTT